MDQKIQGGTATPPPLPTALPAGERDKDGGGGKKDEEEEKKKREREKECTPLDTSNPAGGVGSDGAGGGAPGAPGGGVGGSVDQSHFSIKESSLSEGNVKLKIGLQAKRMKKPPKILESYECRPAFRATVRHTTPRSNGGSGSARGGRTGAGAPEGPLANAHVAPSPPPPPPPPPTLPPPLHSREREREPSPQCLNSRPNPSPPGPGLASGAVAATLPPSAVPPASSSAPSPSQTNGNNQAKKVSWGKTTKKWVGVQIVVVLS